MDLYARLSDKSLLKLYRIARHRGDFVRANDILQALQDRDIGLNLRLIIEFGSAGNLAHINRASHYVLTTD